LIFKPVTGSVRVRKKQKRVMKDALFCEQPFFVVSARAFSWL